MVYTRYGRLFVICIGVILKTKSTLTDPRYFVGSGENGESGEKGGRFYPIFSGRMRLVSCDFTGMLFWITLTHKHLACDLASGSEDKKLEISKTPS